jgi:hypothetical protein
MLALRYRRSAVLARLVVGVLVAVFAWPTLGEACCFGVQAVAVEWAQAGAADDDCCPNDVPSEDRKGDHSGPCSCPLSCSSGCAGVGRALAVTPAFQLVQPGGVVMDGQFGRVALPPAPDPHDILHVPKRLVA